jgi:hypothetical protein
MTIETFKLDNGKELKIDTNSSMFKAYEKAAENIGIVRKDESFFFARNLEYIRQQVFKPVYSKLKLLNGGLLPIDSAIPEGADNDTYDILDGSGEANIITDYADDISTAEISGEQVTNGIKSLASSYLYSVQDVRKDKMLGAVGRSSVTNKAMFARLTVDQKIEKMLGFGDSNFGISGIFNNENVPSSAVADTGTGSTTQWANKTAANILADIEEAINDMIDISGGNEEPTDMWLDHTSYHLIKKKALDVSNYSGVSILKYIQEEYGLNVNWIQQLKSGFTNNTESGFVLLNKDATDDGAPKFEGVLPIRLMPHAPQVKNLATKNILEARCGGVRVYYPYSVSYNTGI